MRNEDLVPRIALVVLRTVPGTIRDVVEMVSKVADEPRTTTIMMLAPHQMLAKIVVTAILTSMREIGRPHHRAISVVGINLKDHDHARRLVETAMEDTAIGVQARIPEFARRTRTEILNCLDELPTTYQMFRS